MNQRKDRHTHSFQSLEIHPLVDLSLRQSNPVLAVHLLDAPSDVFRAALLRNLREIELEEVLHGEWLGLLGIR